ncbi:1-acyl-sn-glycerol-3-phosphate acyltransferase [Motiliproteus sp. MSK22-1]|uniref:lysophospholipid acyltransferase family protein n=1 Tax=Motiliproteus sp. MSK22-1 TaxID=1897630 RepID=UPI0009783AB8|nr:lysophospholipid acyltransferase family protein [Motiliproteus sp. MSK22-1]OMH28416.1 acyl-phosphate glycerol 3-phosphate acyltransferase [Motiliproteus sp. MSK22-1]
MVLYLRAMLFSGVFLPVTVLYALLSLLFFSWLPFNLRFLGVTGINHFFLWWGKVVCGVRYEVVGLDNLPKSGGYVILANHQSEWETFFLQVATGPLSTVLKKELLKIPFFGWALALLKPIAIDRSERSGALKQILKQGKERLKSGIPVLIFPQGTRVKAGQLGRFNKGGAMLACSAKVPVVTIAHNAGEFWPSKSFLKYPGVIKVVIGPVIDTQGGSVDEIHQQSKDWLEQQLLEFDGYSEHLCQQAESETKKAAH